MSPKITKPLDVYVRVSAVRGREGESFISPKDQEARCRALAQARGYAIGDVFTDLDVSGGTMDRPAFNQALERIRSGVSGGIIVARMDRFSRTLKGAIETLEEIEAAGGYLIECDGDWDTSTPMGRFGRDLVIRLGQLYREQIAESWKTSKREAVARGVHVTRHIPPGYVRAQDGRLELHPKHSKTVAEAYRMAARGVAPARIAEYLTEQKLPSGDNEAPAWKSSRISRLLANRVYLGEARANSEIVNGKAHEPLIDSATWHLAQRKRGTRAVSNRGSYLLSGLVRCASCRSSMGGMKETKWAPATYRCSGGGSAGKCPHPSTITMARLDDLVFEQYADRVLAQLNESEPERPDDSEARAALEDAEQALSELEAKKGELHPIAYAEAQTALLNDVETARGRFAERQRLAGLDIGAVAQELLPKIQADIDRVAAGGRPLDGINEDGKRVLHHAMTGEIHAVFVRPPERRSKSLPIADRVHIVWSDSGEELELPSRGTAFEPRAYSW